MPMDPIFPRHRRGAWLLALWLAAPVALAEAPLERQGPSGEAMVADLVLARPLGLAATGLGAAFFVLSLPFTIPLDSVDTAAEKLVREPARFTFTRPLGDI